MGRWLGAHPDAHLAPEKEVQYFNLFHDRGQDWYRSRFAAATEGQVVGEATPVYLYDDVVLGRIAEEVPDAALVVLLREPVGRAWSQYHYLRAIGAESVPWQVAVEHPERAAFDHLGMSRYLPRLEAAARICGRDRLLVLFSEDLRADPVAVLGSLARHIGIDPLRNPPLADRNVGRTPRLPGAVHRPLVRVGGRLPTGAGRAWMRALTRPGSPRLDPAERRRLADGFRQHNEALAGWLGRPLPEAWTI